MIKIEKIEKGYLRCQSCNDEGSLNSISIGLNLNNTSSFRLCSDCLSFFSNEINKVKLEKLQEQNKILREALEFYSKTNHWLGLTDKVPFDITKWIRIVEDDMDQNNIGGKRAREALAKVGE